MKAKARSARQTAERPMSVMTSWIDQALDVIVESCRLLHTLPSRKGDVLLVPSANARPFFPLFSLVHNVQIRPLLFITYNSPKVVTIPDLLAIDYHEWHIMNQCDVQKALTCAFYISTSLRYMKGVQRCLNDCDDVIIAVVGVTSEGTWHVYGSSDEKELRCVLINLIRECCKECGDEFEGNMTIAIHSSTNLLAELDLSFDRVEIKQMDEVHLTPCDDAWVAGDGNNNNNMMRPLSLFVLAGQSNMAGRVQLLPPVSVEQRTSSSDQCHCCRDQDVVGVGVDSTSTSSSSLTCHHCYVSLPFGVCQAADAFRSRIISYDPLLGWTHEAGASLHANVDILKRATVGIGPGSSFAIEYLRLRDLLIDTSTEDSRSSTTSDSGGGSVGLIPVSVGSTFLAEWTADYLPKSTQMPALVGHVATALSACSSSSIAQPSGSVVVLDYDVSNQGFVNVPANARYHHNNGRDIPVGCCNLMSCAMRSVYRALVSLPASQQGLYPSSSPHHSANADVNEEKQHYVHALPLLTGLLWYQGENDCSSTSDNGGDEFSTTSANSYGDRCVAVIGQFRMLITAVTALARMARGEVDVDATRSSLRNLIIAGTKRDTQKDNCDTADTVQGTASLGDQEPPKINTIPVVSVAVTTTRPWLVHLPTIRQQQLAMPKRVTYLSVVDAFGCALQPDGVHLTTEAALQLGEMIAVDMAKLVVAITPSWSRSKDSYVSILQAAAANTMRKKVEAEYLSLWEQCQIAKDKVQSQAASADAGNHDQNAHIPPYFSSHHTNINTTTNSTVEDFFASRGQLSYQRLKGCELHTRRGGLRGLLSRIAHCIQRRQQQQRQQQ